MLPVKFFKETFCGVVVRNIPAETKPEDIENFLGRKNLPCKIDSINQLRGEYFGLVTMETFDMCEKACILLNDRQINKRRLKAHVHPETCGQRDYAQVAENLKPAFREDEDLASTNLAKLRSLLEDAKLQEEVRRLETELLKHRRPEVFDRSREHRDPYKREPVAKHYDRHEKDHRRRDSRERNYVREDKGDKEKRSRERHHARDEREDKKKDRKSPKPKKEEVTPSPKKEELKSKEKSKEKPKEVSPKPDVPEAGEVKPKESKWKKEGSQQKTEGGSEKRKGKDSGRHK